jgi:hypothetical protein
LGTFINSCAKQGLLDSPSEWVRQKFPEEWKKLEKYEHPQVEDNLKIIKVDNAVKL